MGRTAPTQLTRFIGRQEALAAVQRLLAGSRLITLIGPGGSGKTRLAAEVSRRVANEYTGGIAWVDLAPISEESLVARRAAAGLGLPRQVGRPSLEALLDALEGQNLLLVIDNCEHLITACAGLADALLRRCPDLQILVTSREPLALPGEQIYHLPALSYPTAAEMAALPAAGALKASVLERLAAYEAILLFVDRAAAVQPAFSLTGENARAVATICRRLDGMPLAIELAAARINVLTPGEIAGRLDDRFSLLRANHRGAVVERHQTLRGVMDWSHDLLPAAEQILLRRLSVFAGCFTLPSVEQVCGGNGLEEKSLLDHLSALINKSLVQAETAFEGAARYDMLESIRQYAAEKLDRSGEKSAIQDRFLFCYLRLVEEVEAKLIGPYQELWLNWLEEESVNIRAALAWALASGRLEEGLRITIALYNLWTIRDLVDEGLAWLERLLAQGEGIVSDLVHIIALAQASFLSGFHGNWESQEAYGNRAAALAEALGDQGKPALVWAHSAKGYAARALGDYETEYAFALKALQLNRELGRTLELGISLTTSSFTAMALGRLEEARVLLDEGLPLVRQIGNPYRIAMALNFAGDLARCLREFERARSAYEESLGILRSIQAVRDTASSLHNLGHAVLHLGEVEKAHPLFLESMASHKEQGNRPGMTECLLGFAALAVVSDLPAEGARLLAAAAKIGGEHITFRWAATRGEYEHYLARARAALSEDEFVSAKAAGEQMTLEQAVQEAEVIAHQAAAARQRRRDLDELTPREREVAALIARAKTNEQIAAELVLSKRTVEKHIANIRAKLDFSERAQIVRWAIESGLVDFST